MRTSSTLALLAAALACGAAGAAPTISSNPTLPTYGAQIGIVLEADWPVFLPATRYSRSGSTIVIDYEYITAGFGPARPDFGYLPLPLGELPPGNYTVEARLHDINKSGTPTVVRANLPVVPPQSYGMYTVPAQPEAFAPAYVTVKSAAYLDPSSLRARVSGNVVRVDFTWIKSAPGTSTAPDGMTTYASVRIPGLAPGSYKIEGWGTPQSGGATELFFNKDFVVASSAPVVEFYAPAIDHYFMAAGADEIAALDSGASPGWKRTGQGFTAWTRAGDAPPNAQGVCRFHARGPNSHFYTANRAECDYLKSIEQQQRQQATAEGKQFLGWGYEGIAFHALVPTNGQCQPGTQPVYRAYNNRAAEMDSNHRFTADPSMHAAMTATWADEGVVFCSPSAAAG